MNDPFDTRVINPLEKPLSSDIDLAESQIFQTIRNLLWWQLIGRTATANPASLPNVYTGFYGDGFQVQPVTGQLQVQLNAGMGFAYNSGDEPTAIGAIVGLNDLSPLKPIVMMSPLIITGIPTAPSTPNTRYDIVEIDYNRYLTDATSVLQLNTTSGVFAPNTVQKTLSFDVDSLFSVVPYNAASTSPIGYKYGNAGNPGTVPATTSGYTKIAEILVGSGVTDLEPSGSVGVVNDLRKVLFPTNIGDISFNVTIPYSGGNNTPTLSDVHAPAGVTVVAVGGTPSAPTNTPTAYGRVTILIWGGDLTNSVVVNPVLTVTCPNANGGGFPLYTAALVPETYSGGAPGGGMTSALQTALGATEASTNPTPVALNQPFVQIALSVNNTATGAVTYNCHLRLRGG